MIKEGELINETINGRVRLGKSTIGIHEGQRYYKLLQKYGHRKPEEKFGIKNIARDQQEYSRIMMNPETQFTVIVTDEINKLEKGGENVTVENQLQDVFSEVQAGRYVHRISCSPNEITDNQSDIILEVVSTNKREKTTHCRFYYRIVKAGTPYTVLLGHVNIYVGDLIKNWEEIKKTFYKQKKTPEEEQKIKEYARKDYYVDYMIKKYEKMEMITREGIFRPRILNYAGIILETTRKLKELTKLHNVVTKDTIKNYIKMGFREKRIPTSIIGEELATQEATGILNIYKNVYKLMFELNDLYRELKNNKIDQETFNIRSESINKMLIELKNAITQQEEELEKYVKINEKYNTFESVIE